MPPRGGGVPPPPSLLLAGLLSVTAQPPRLRSCGPAPYTFVVDGDRRSG
eukprot:gene30574-61395_t